MLRLRTAVPLAAGEQFGSKWEFRELVENEWIDYARVDLCLAGGITEAKKVAAMCETHHVKLAAHNPLGPVSTATCCHLPVPDWVWSWIGRPRSDDHSGWRNSLTSAVRTVRSRTGERRASREARHETAADHRTSE